MLGNMRIVITLKPDPYPNPNHNPNTTSYPNTLTEPYQTVLTLTDIVGLQCAPVIDILAALGLPLIDVSP